MLSVWDGVGGWVGGGGGALSRPEVKAPLHYQALSYDPISCDGKTVERTNEIAYSS